MRSARFLCSSRRSLYVLCPIPVFIPPEPVCALLHPAFTLLEVCILLSDIRISPALYHRIPDERILIFP